MQTITLAEAQANFAELIRRLSPRDEIEITDRDETIARLLTVSVRRPKQPRKLGALRGTVISMEHFDDPLEEFEEHM